MNGYRARKIYEMKNVIFGFQLHRLPITNTVIYGDNSSFSTPYKKCYVPSNNFKTLCFFIVFKNFLVSTITITISNEMLVRMLAIHFDQNYSYEITMNGSQARKQNKMRNIIG